MTLDPPPYPLPLNVWRDWAGYRNTIRDDSLRAEKFKVVPGNMHDMTKEELGFCLARFVNEVRNAKGDYYPPKS